MKKKEFNQWKIAAICFLTLALLILIVEEYSKQKCFEDNLNCNLKKDFCINSLNESLQGWHQCIVNFGMLHFNLTEEEIETKLNLGETFYLIQNGGSNEN